MYPISFALTENVVEVARRAEALGYDSVWGNDHMSTQAYVREEFPDPPNFWEPLITYAFLAAQTTTLRFGTALLVLPMRRDIVVTAKQIATLDHFSGGRLGIGIGVGAYREEFEALQPGRKVHRGEMVEEGIQALRVLFTERVASFDGKYYQYRDVEMFPKPVQKPFPLYIGGNSAQAVRRAALYGNGWNPACIHATSLRAKVTELKGLATERGNDPDRIEIAPQYIVYIDKTYEKATSYFRRTQMYKHLETLHTSTLKDQGTFSHEEVNLIGTVDDVIEKVKGIQEAGATHLLGLYFAVNEFSELPDQMQVFSEEVMPAL